MVHIVARLLGRFSQVNWALADQALVSGVNFLTGILIARFLGLEEFGRFTLVWMAVLFLALVQQAVIISPMMSIGPKQSEAESPAYFGAVMFQQIVFSALAFILVLIGVYASDLLFPQWQVRSLALPLAVAGFAYQLQDFLRRYFFTRSHPALAFINDAIRYLGQLALLLWFFGTAILDSAGVLWIIATTGGVALIVGAVVMEYPTWDRNILHDVTRRHWHVGKWLLGSTPLRWAATNSFIIVAGVLLGASAVGALKAAQNLMGVTHVLFFGLQNNIPVQAARHLTRDGKETMVVYLRRAALLGEMAVAGIAVVFISFPEFWLRLAFGAEFAEYGYLLRWYAVIYLVMFLELPLQAGLRAVEFTRPLFYAYLYGCLFALAAVYPLVHWLELNGAMGGLLAVWIIQIAILMNGFSHRLK